ncbi:MAG: hypothetical protein K0S21_3719 [Rhizobiaceae bacterium]|nr:hypothetical protein [Rhizobiaceae bacterium]
MTTVYNGELYPSGDDDSYTEHLTRGNTYQIDLDGLVNGSTDSTSPGVLDPILSIYDSNHNLVASNDDANGAANRDSHIDFTPTQSGDYTFVVTGFNNETGDYTLTIA